MLFSSIAKLKLIVDIADQRARAMSLKTFDSQLYLCPYLMVVRPSQIQGDFFQSKSGTGVLQSLIWDFRGPKRLLCSPKNGRKLLLGKKHTVVSRIMSQEGDHQKEEMPDLENLD